MTNLRMITAPTAEPLTLADARTQCRVDAAGSPPVNLEDELLRSLIRSARESAEQFLGVVLTDAIYEYRVDAFCSVIALPVAPVGAVLGITYVDEFGVTQTLSPATYVFDGNLAAPSVRLAYQASWPATRSEANAIVIRFQGWYTSASSPPQMVPEPIRSGMKLIIGHLFRNREQVVKAQANEIPMGAQYFMQPFRRDMGV